MNEEKIVHNEKVSEILQELQRVIRGKDEVIKRVLMAIVAGGNVLLEDSPGVGKTTLCLALGKVLGMEFKRISFTPDTMPSDITGFSMWNKNEERLVYQPGPVMTNLLLADEINRTSGKTQSALLEVMEERQVTVDGESYLVPEPFVVIATQNPVGSAGTWKLPVAQLDRFMVKLSMGYPNLQDEIEMLKDRHTDNPLNFTREVVTSEELVRMQRECEEVFVADAAYEFAALLSAATREHEKIELGISPRGTLAVCAMAKAAAYIGGRTYVEPKDIVDVFPMVASHRIILSRSARLAGVSANEILVEIANSTRLPESGKL